MVEPVPVEVHAVAGGVGVQHTVRLHEQQHPPRERCSALVVHSAKTLAAGQQRRKVVACEGKRGPIEAEKEVRQLGDQAGQDHGAGRGLVKVSQDHFERAKEV